MYKKSFQNDEPPVLSEYDSSITATKNKLRKMREEVCFPVINRGRLWYNKLTTEQFSELHAWYEAWLDVTDSLKIPKTPTWINDKLEQEDIY
jgi:hypothetical protein